MIGKKQTAKEVLKKTAQDEVKFIDLQFTDFVGRIKCVTIPVEQLPDSLESGTWFDGSSVEGFARIHESDMILKPDPATCCVIPWKSEEKKTARIICDVYTPNGEPFHGDPRYILKKTLKEAYEQGFTFYTGPELEFFLFKPENGKIAPVPHDVGGYFDYSARDLASDVRSDIIFALKKQGMYVEMSHHEVAQGQHEIDIRYSDALTMADWATVFKHTVKAIAQEHGLYATFMPKPIFGINGSGMHVNQSLFDKKGKTNLFYDKKDEYRLSDTAKQYIAGQLKYARQYSAIVASTVNSYKRLVPGYEAPVYICWGKVNRSALVRIPRYSPGREKATRIEVRCPDPAGNIYLTFAAMLKAGLAGIKEELSPPAPVEENVYDFNDDKLKKFYIKTLPESLGGAIKELEKSTMMKECFGENLHATYVSAKNQEWDEYRIQVTQWEIDRYLEKL